MRFPKAVVCVHGLLAICPAVLAQAPVVTETKRVENWVKPAGGTVLLRKINGRWWSPDNIEVNPPSKGGLLWTLQSDPGVVQFFHHRPFQLGRAESLHLWMTADQVEAALGQPNTIFGKAPHDFWSYFAADGTKLSVHFMDDGLGEAKYERAGEKSRPVASVAADLNGRDIYALSAERAWKKVQEADAQRKEQFHADQAARREAARTATVPAASAFKTRPVEPKTVIIQPAVALQPAQPEPPATKHIVSAEALAAVTPGTSRQDVLSKLGEPSSRSAAFTSAEGTRESFTYDLESGASVVIRLLDGKVATVR